MYGSFFITFAELKSSLETIRSTAAEIINSIDENLAELQKAQDKEQTAGQEQPTREGQEAAPEKPDPEAAAPGKSGAQEKAGAAPKEAFTPETIYRVRRNPYSDSRENSYLLQAYVTQENGRAKMGDVLYTGTPEKCRELMGQLKSGELTEGDVKQLYAKAQETAQTAGQDKDTFSIYQIKGGDETRDFRFEPYDRLQAAGNVVDRANYELVYSAPLAPETSLEDIYTCFNIDHPKDFKGHSLSVSDVVVLHQDGQDAAHFVDSVGFREVPEFFKEQKAMFDRLGCDYMIMGQHFMKSEQTGPYTGTPTDDESRIREYVDTVIEGMKTGMYSYLAHPDLINYQGLDSVYEWEMTRMCKALKELNIPLEINMLGISAGKHYPTERFWCIPHDIGNKVILGLDAHTVDNICDVESYEKALDIVRKYDLNLIDRIEI